MKGFKQCERGHFYKEELDSCNYCPKPGAGNTTQAGLDEKTQIFGSQTGILMEGDKTQVTGLPETNTPLLDPVGSKRDLNKTFIQGMGTSDTGELSSSPRSNRRIMGWIISYTLDPMGMDYRIYEGNNTVGRDISNSIVILKDQGVSSKHITILSKKDKFYLKDEMAANGTFLNDTEIAIGTAYDLKDNDEIRLGTTTIFRFKSAI